MFFKYLACCIVATVFIFSCKKTVDDSQNSVIKLNHCVEKKFNGEIVRLCFNSVEDSRCPAVCIWEGVAKANFTITVNNEQRSFNLTTNKKLSGYYTDTILLGYKIRLVDIRPHPSQPSSAPKAEVEITQ